MESIGKSMKHHNQRSIRLQRLRCSVQNYDWGKRGTDSLVARLSALNSSSEIDPEKPYAEIWMGTHESGPSFLIQNGDENNGFLSIGSESLSLKDWVLENPKVLGEKVVQKWGSDLPFLFKVLLFLNMKDSICHIYSKVFWVFNVGVVDTVEIFVLCF